jgi:uncharacterized protein involved in exopolysaccharide biosynthesis
MEPAARQVQRRRLPWKNAGSIHSRYRPVLLGTTGLLLAAVFVCQQLTSDRYRSEATLYVKPDGAAASGADMASEVELITSRTLLEHAIDETGTDRFLRIPAANGGQWAELAREELEAARVRLKVGRELSERERVILLVESRLEVKPEPDSDLLAVSFEHEDPELARTFLSRLVDHYLRERLAIFQQEAVGPFLEARVQETTERLQEIEAAKIDVRQRWNVTSVADQRRLLLAELAELNRELEAGSTERDRLLQEQSRMKEKLEALPEQVRSSEVAAINPSAAAIEGRIVELRIRRAELLGLYTPTAPPVRNVDDEIADLTKALSSMEPSVVDTVTSIAHPLKAQFQQEIHKIEVRIAGLDAAIPRQREATAVAERRLHELDRAEGELLALDRQEQLTKQSLLTFAAGRDEARIDQELDARRASNVAVLSKPSTPFLPMHPWRRAVIAALIPGGLLLGSWVALLSYRRRYRLAEEWQLFELDGAEYLGAGRVEKDGLLPGAAPLGGSSPVLPPELKDRREG